MRWLRSTWRLRAVVVLLAAGLLPMAIVWPERAATHAPSKSHADWLRMQVRVEMDGNDREAFEAAIEAAVQKEAHALRDFLQHFAAAYAQQAEGPSLAQLFGVSAGAPEQVLDEIQHRLAQVSGWATVPRLSTALYSVSFSLQRNVAAVTTPRVPSIFAVFRTVAVHAPQRLLGTSLLHALSSSRPRAP